MQFLYSSVDMDTIQIDNSRGNGKFFFWSYREGHWRNKFYIHSYTQVPQASVALQVPYCVLQLYRSLVRHYVIHTTAVSCFSRVAYAPVGTELIVVKLILEVRF